ncbi:hypothetical protein P879_02874 [Paragonimus westermani]|uniref:RING-type domain-containing protein n=1 Tax=Paragonimus westermani TaxID=34504 RepID=A0A8T0DPP5_9TREM|nr:hypothetical protein P879_02874 [Paragonimus westermani]
MFGEDIFNSIFKTPFFEPHYGVGTPHRSSSVRREVNVPRERCSQSAPRDIFTEFSRAADELFAAATRSFFQRSQMLPRHFYPSYLREISHIPSNTRRASGLTLSGDVVDRTIGGANARQYRHTNMDPVHMERTRLQWYDSNTRRALVATPASNRSVPSGRLTAVELAKLPLSTYRIKPGLSNNSQGSSGESTVLSPGTSSSPVPVLNANSSSVDCSPGSAYLQPVSKLPTVVEIQPLLSSPSRGQPECEVCLTEYRNNDQLRHLPCGHAFHSKCVDVWFAQSSTCPKCRAGVRTGLRRLERSQQRARVPTARSTSVGAPVRAIRQRVPVTVTASSRGTRRQTNHSSQSTRPRVTSRSSPSNSHPGAERSRDSLSFEEANLSGANEEPRMIDSNSPLHTVELITGNPRLLDNTVGISEFRETLSYRTNQSENNRTQQSQRGRSETRLASGTSHTQRTNTVTSTPDKSAIARKKAAEAAIRRAELASQEREQLTNQQ